jgi:hypothetical protein
MKLNGTDSPSLLFKGIHCRNLLDPDRIQVFDFILHFIALNPFLDTVR